MSETKTPDHSASASHEAEIDNSNRSTTPQTDKFLNYIMSGWGEADQSLPAERKVASFAAQRRQALGAQFVGQRLVIQAGAMKQRSNDTFYQFRAHSAFSHLTGWGSESEPGAILVLDPVSEGAGSASTHEATIYFRERAGRDSEEFFANPEIGEFWIGPRPSLAQVAADLGVRTAHLADFAPQADDLTLEDSELARVTSELRLVKDSYELEEMQAAVDATARGFDEVLAGLDRAVAEPRGERVVEGVFNMRARLDGNTVGYETIAAAGHHACTLHWIENNGVVREGDLMLLDAGVEMDSLYTADITRTIPISGSFSEVQRRVYEAVLEAADAARAIVRPGIRFGDVHDAAMVVIERKTREWGLLPEVDGGDDTPYHRRYMVHGTSHHLGLDVHDCAQARRELYLDGKLEEGMVFTIEPGLYFQPDDLTVPAEYRGIGVRIEDDIVVTADGCVNLSADIPRDADAVEAWVKEMRGR
ncbi:aminopeptidase P family protein [Leucobacter sp. UT-8R-CII-1-4]|uniref:aminopeptidase P family protein n=1 Tax=Leucobacter sp. UT-8R-CII-1-4 TaxID=3040075 RepID=UPI0024A93753|nr:aminopeptidase P family protein [Leucobacter sp. UT-8R-CII-1-4]MDI6023126.1 aminopeptidase P family protein [Leucobacter sp. UT-8R-CII-1-4]